MIEMFYIRFDVLSDTSQVSGFQLQVSSILTLSAWSWCQIPQGKEALTHRTAPTSDASRHLYLQLVACEARVPMTPSSRLIIC